MPYKNKDKENEYKHIWNKAFYAGVKYIILQVVAYLNDYDKPQCFKCGETRTFLLQLHHTEKLKLNQRINWSIWKEVDKMEIYCNKHHIEEDKKGDLI